MAGTIGRRQNLVVKDGKVEGKTEANGMRWGEVGLRALGGLLVGFVGCGSGIFALVSGGEFGKVTVVVSFPTRISLVRYTLENTYIL